MLIYRLSLTDASRGSSFWKMTETFRPALNKRSLDDCAQAFYCPQSTSYRPLPKSSTDLPMCLPKDLLSRAVARYRNSLCKNLSTGLSQIARRPSFDNSPHTVLRDSYTIKTYFINVRIAPDARIRFRESFDFPFQKQRFQIVVFD